jgi:hypothetical protein
VIVKVFNEICHEAFRDKVCSITTKPSGWN